MTRNEYYAKWCRELNTCAEREHMALQEAGYSYMQLHLIRRACGHEHFGVIWYDLRDPPLEVITRVHRLIMPDKMYEDAVAANLIGIHRGIITMGRVR